MSSLPSPCMSISRRFETAGSVGALVGFIPRFTNDIGLAGGQTVGRRQLLGGLSLVIPQHAIEVIRQLDDTPRRPRRAGRLRQVVADERHPSDFVAPRRIGGGCRAAETDGRSCRARGPRPRSPRWSSQDGPATGGRRSRGPLPRRRQWQSLSPPPVPTVAATAIARNIDRR